MRTMLNLVAGAVAILGALGGFWLMCWLFHVVPIPDQGPDTWWSFPWMFTCIGAWIALAGLSLWAASEIEKRAR